MAKVKIQAPGGGASAGPPLGPALGQHGVNIGEVVNAFNTQTQENKGTITPAIVTIYADRSFDIEIKTPPAAVLIKKKL